MLLRDCPQGRRWIFDHHFHLSPFTTVFCMVDPFQQALMQVFGGVTIISVESQGEKKPKNQICRG